MTQLKNSDYANKQVKVEVAIRKYERKKNEAIKELHDNVCECQLKDRSFHCINNLYRAYEKGELKHSETILTCIFDIIHEPTRNREIKRFVNRFCLKMPRKES